jgi:cysteine-rich repeat protein
MEHHRLRRAVVLGAFLAVGSLTRAWAAEVPWTGSLTIDFSQLPGGTSVTYPTAFAGTAVVNDSSGVLTPITKLGLYSENYLFSTGPAAQGAFGGTFGFGVRAGGTMGAGLYYLSVYLGGTCTGSYASYANCPGGGLAGFGGLDRMRHVGIQNSYYIDPVFGGGGRYGTVFTSYLQTAFGAGWTTGQVKAYGFATSVSNTLYTFTATSTGGVAGSTISLVSPIVIVDENFAVPFRVQSPGIARLTINLQGLVCGDSLISSGEGCDDGGVAPGDGCDATCQIEVGYSCTGAPSVCSLCGDGAVAGGEGCDDSGVAPGDGCDATCQIEAGYGCTGAPSVCSPICGDGVILGGEGCDDADAVSGDGCSATCQIEPGYSCAGAPSVCTQLVTSTPVAATKLIIVDKGANGAKAVFVAKDAAITKGAGTSTATIGVTLDVGYDNGTDPASAGQFVGGVGSANWIVNKTSVAKYVNKDAPTGGGTKVIVIKPGKLVKLVGKNLGDTPIDIFNQGASATGVADTAFCVDNGSIPDCFCSTFGTCAWKSIAGGTGAKLVCRTGTGDATCEALP